MPSNRLDKELVKRGLVDTRTKAGAMIEAGHVLVNGKAINKAGYYVAPQAEIKLLASTQYVSRGGDKLASVAQKLKLDFRHKIILDVGSSTGGFTDYALQNGASKVYAVDVGTEQLVEKLRHNKRVVVMEQTDIRNLPKLPDPIDIILIDVSFISLKLILPAVAKLANPKTQVVAMAKPHFEADKTIAAKHKGVIKNDKIRRDILKQVEAFSKRWFVILDKADSEVLGRKGNQERFFLMMLPRGKPQVPQGREG